MKKRMVVILSLLVALMLACAISSKTTSPTGSVAGSTPQQQPGGIFSNPTATANPDPVSINDGL